MQSGADNNPAITNDPALRSQILAVDVNAYMVREYRALARIATRLGYDGAVFELKAQGPLRGHRKAPMARERRRLTECEPTVRRPASPSHLDDGRVALG